MKILLILAPLAVALLAAIGTIVIGGMFLPKAHKATRSMRFSASPEAVWEVITDFRAQTSWRPGLKSIEAAPDRNSHPVWLETSSQGVLPIEIVEFVPPRRMVGKIAGEKLPFGGTWTYEVAPEGSSNEGASACRVRITEDGEIYNPAFRYIARVMGYHATLEKYLTALNRKLGQNATVEP